MRQICNEISGVFGIHRYLISMDLQFIKRFKLLFQYSHCHLFKDGSLLLSGSNNGVFKISYNQSRWPHKSPDF